jgi:hypothetical protein
LDWAGLVTDWIGLNARMVTYADAKELADGADTKARHCMM